MVPGKRFEHSVQLYENEQDLLTKLVKYFKDGLIAQEVCIIIATPEHRLLVEQRLVEAGFNLEFFKMLGKYIALDAKATLSQFMDGTTPNSQHFHEVIGSLIPYIANQPIRAYGEMVALLWEQGNSKGAIELEDLWNKLGSVREFSLFCAYPTQILELDEGKSISTIHDNHSHVVA